MLKKIQKSCDFPQNNTFFSPYRVRRFSTGFGDCFCRVSETFPSLATEAVYSSDLVLPYQFPLAPDPQNQFYEDLMNSMSGFCPVPARHNTLLATNLPEHVPISLSSCQIVFIWKDSHVSPLSLLYEGPYKVLTCSGRTFRLQIGRVEVVSQRLKPGFTADEETPAVSESVIFNLIPLIIGS